MRSTCALTMSCFQEWYCISAKSFDSTQCFDFNLAAWHWHILCEWGKPECTLPRLWTLVLFLVLLTSFTINKFTSDQIIINNNRSLCCSIIWICRRILNDIWLHMHSTIIQKWITTRIWPKHWSNWSKQLVWCINNVTLMQARIQLILRFLVRTLHFQHAPNLF